MYQFIVQKGDASSNQFAKFNYSSEVRNCIVSNSTNASSFAFNSGMSSAYRDSEAVQQGAHVYRIKDLTDAINTSIIMDGKKKEQYISMLSNSDTEFNADSEFVEICHNLGECDIY
ncbi:MAG: hypothetical protein PUC65_03455 [Clostridiales bacterium]|nr:hypothetical protein [Clostridiales bacterium]